MRTLALATILVLATASAASAQITVEISAQDCRQLVRHVGSDDVTYRPGVDVNGNPVVPADLDAPPPIVLPESITFPLTLDLAERMGIPPGGDADYLARPVIGDISITADGRAALNGVPLTSQTQHELAQTCQRQGTAPQ